jgi:hypothetical protein
MPAPRRVCPTKSFTKNSRLAEPPDARQGGNWFGRHARAWVGRILAAAFLLIVCAGSAVATSNPVPYVDIVSPVSIHPGAMGVTLQVYGIDFQRHFRSRGCAADEHAISGDGELHRECRGHSARPCGPRFQR